MRFWDHLRSNLGIICGRGSFAVSGSFAALYRSRILSRKSMLAKAFDLKYNNRALRDNSEGDNELKIIVDNVLKDFNMSKS